MLGVTRAMAAAAARGVLVLEPGNVTPPARTPWGGTRIAELWPAQRVPGAPLPQQIGEAWIVSGHASFPSMTTIMIDGAPRRVTLRDLCAAAPEAMLGAAGVARYGAQLPVLLKLLNSASGRDAIAQLKIHAAALSTVAPLDMTNVLAHGNYHEIHRALVALLQAEWPAAVQPIREQIAALHLRMLAANLSIQVHPHRGYDAAKPSKTEAWIILDAELGAGIYLGLRDGVTRERFAHVLGAQNFSEGDVSELLNFVPVQSGDVFFIPSGTIHAIGAGVVLLEPQETSETTFRVFDWYRQPARALHIADTLAVTRWDDPRGAAAVAQLRRTPQPAADGAELLVDAPEFQVRRWTAVGTDAIVVGGVCGLYIVLQGAVQTHDAARSPLSIGAGQSFVMPHAGVCPLVMQPGSVLIGVTLGEERAG